MALVRIVATEIGRTWSYRCGIVAYGSTSSLAK